VPELKFRHLGAEENKYPNAVFSCENCLRVTCLRPAY